MFNILAGVLVHAYATCGCKSGYTISLSNLRKKTNIVFQPLSLQNIHVLTAAQTLHVNIQIKRPKLYQLVNFQPISLPYTQIKKHLLKTLLPFERTSRLQGGFNPVHKQKKYVHHLQKHTDHVHLAQSQILHFLFNILFEIHSLSNEPTQQACAKKDIFTFSILFKCSNQQPIQKKLFTMLMKPFITFVSQMKPFACTNFKCFLLFTSILASSLSTA